MPTAASSLQDRRARSVAFERTGRPACCCLLQGSRCDGEPPSVEHGARLRRRATAAAADGHACLRAARPGAGDRRRLLVGVDDVPPYPLDLGRPRSTGDRRTGNARRQAAKRPAGLPAGCWRTPAAATLSRPFSCLCLATERESNDRFDDGAGARVHRSPDDDDQGALLGSAPPRRSLVVGRPPCSPLTAAAAAAAAARVPASDRRTSTGDGTSGRSTASSSRQTGSGGTELRRRPVDGRAAAAAAPTAPATERGGRKKVASAGDDAPAARVSEQQPADPIRRVVDDRAPVARLAAGQRHYCRCCHVDPPAVRLLPSCCYAVVIRASQLPARPPPPPPPLPRNLRAPTHSRAGSGPCSPRRPVHQRPRLVADPAHQQSPAQLACARVLLFFVALGPAQHESDARWSCWLGPHHAEHTPSRPIWEVKQRRARLVLAWVTGWEYRVPKPLTYFCNAALSDPRSQLVFFFFSP